MKRAVLIALAAALLTGCGQIHGLNSFTPVSRMELTTSAKAEADGIPIRLTLYQRDDGRVTAVRADGAIEVLMFEGESRQLAEATPMHTWLITPEQLKYLQGRYYGLPCYLITLKWPGRIPTSPTVTILARYPRGDGRTVYSAPVVVRTR